ncbi:hypothetical protein EWB00_000509 [Schistosoma japonicum]|uniref:Uncharacterized protein n=1 Tax=Schistosoma japonicum TaxID=6182 RepID=A0A4Z2DIW0_SCHJA|nr:hypothetical protein EWB00_000509 [Schistosoma japonicum]
MATLSKATYANAAYTMVAIERDPILQLHYATLCKFFSGRVFTKGKPSLLRETKNILLFSLREFSDIKTYYQTQLFTKKVRAGQFSGNWSLKLGTSLNGNQPSFNFMFTRTPCCRNSN